MGENQQQQDHTGPSAVRATLLALALVVGLTLTITGVVVIAEAAAHGTPAAGVVLAGLSSIICGWCAAGLLFATAWMVARIGRMEPRPPGGRPTEPAAATRPTAMSPAPPVILASAEPPKRAAVEDDLGKRILLQLEELSANILLTDAQRQAKLQRQQDETVTRLSAQIREAIEKGHFALAQELLAALGLTAGGAEAQAELAPLLAQAQAGTQAGEAAEISRRVEDLMALGKFDDAIEAARLFQQRYAQSQEGQDLLRHVQREADTFHTEQRKRLHAQIQKDIDARQWRQVQAAARRLLEAYPDSKEAKSMAKRMLTIEENARIEEVRELRDQIRDLIERRRFGEAVTLAEDVIRRFPQTQAADTLQEQLPRSRQKAAEEERNK